MSAMTLNLSIPQRSTSGALPGDPGFRYETARTTILVDCNADPAGATLTLLGTQVALGGPSQTIAGDLLRFRRIPNQNRVRIDLFLNSDFLGGDCRNYDSAVPHPRSFSLTLTTPAACNATAYRMAGYCAASSAVSGGAYRRIDNLPPTLATSPAISSSGRLPIDVVLVMDRSGSMYSTIPGPAGMRKFALLQSSLVQFLSMFKAEQTSVADDRTALVWFESAASTESFGGNPWVKRDDWNTLVVPKINSQTTAGWTAMGDGISQGFHAWYAEELNNHAPNDPVLVLLTDGEQNIGNLIEDRPGSPVGLEYFDIDSSPASWQLLHNRPIPIQSIGVGAYPAYFALLDQIGTQTGGNARIEIDPANIGPSFVDQLIDVLKGNTLSLVERDSGTLAAGVGQTMETAFSVGVGSGQIMFALNWLGTANADVLDLTVIAPNGQAVTPAGRQDGPYFTVQTVPGPRRGQWRVRVQRRGNAAGNASLNRAVPYSLSVLVNEGSFAFGMQLAHKDHMVGSEFRLLLDLSEKAFPLDLHGVKGSITVDVFPPPVPMGRFLHEFPLPDPRQMEATYKNEFADITSPLALKLDYLDKLGLLRELGHAKPATSIPIEFTGDGKLPHGVEFKGGMLLLRLEDTRLAGQYRLGVRIDIETKASGPIQRREEIRAHLRPGPVDPKRTIVRAKPHQFGKYYYVDVLPVDRFGNYYGPGHDTRIDLALVDGKGRVSHLPRREADGWYTFRVSGVKPGQKLQIRAGGKPIRIDSLEHLMAVPQLAPKTWETVVSHFRSQVHLQRKTTEPSKHE